MLSVALFSWNKQKTFAVFAQSIAQVRILASKVRTDDPRLSNENKNQVGSPRQFFMKFLTSDWIIFGAMNFLAFAPVEARDVLGEKFDQVAAEWEIGIFDRKFDFNFFLEIV